MSTSAALPAAAATTAAARTAGVRTQAVTGALGALPAGTAKHAALNRLTAQAPALKQSVIQHAFIPQAAKGLALALKQGEGTVTINLKPAHLGSLRVEVSKQGAEIAARLEVSNETARQLLTDAQPSLRAALEARGLSVERIDVTLTPQAASSRDPADQRPGPDHQPEQHGAGQQDRHTGGGAGPHTDDGRGQRGNAELEHTTDAWPAQPLEVTLSLDHGGIYRLHLDAVA